MTYYHCSPVSGLKVLEPRKPESFDKPALVYMTTLLSMALLYGVKNYEYTYGYTREKQIHMDGYFPNELEILYKGKSASLYICQPETAEPARIPNEVVSNLPVKVLEEITIPDVYEALMEQERLGNLLIRRYHEIPEQMIAWIRKVEADGIRNRDLPHNPGPMADYYRTHYPDSWQDVVNENQALG